MAIPRSMGWLVVTGGIVLALVGLSFLALDKQNVVWGMGRASCPHCRTAVPFFAKRCPTCREEFDWVVAPDEESPWCDQCLTPGEDEALRLRRKALTEEVAVQRVAQALSITPAAATTWMHGVGRGQCGWCGGTGTDLAAATTTEALPCPVCFGEKRCIACDGDRRVRVGLEASHAEFERYRAAADVLSAPATPLETARSEIKTANEAFLRRHAGTVEAATLWFPPLFLRGNGEAVPRAATMARQRLQNVLSTLRAP